MIIILWIRVGGFSEDPTNQTDFQKRRWALFLNTEASNYVWIRFKSQAGAGGHLNFSFNRNHLLPPQFGFKFAK